MGRKKLPYEGCRGCAYRARGTVGRWKNACDYFSMTGKTRSSQGVTSEPSGRCSLYLDKNGKRQAARKKISCGESVKPPSGGVKKKERAMKQFTCQDYIDALFDDGGNLIGPKQTEMIRRRALEDENITIKEYVAICSAAQERRQS